MRYLHISFLITLIPALSSFVEATEVLASENYPSASSIMPTLLSLLKFDLQESQEDNEIVKTFKQKVVRDYLIKIGLLDYWKNNQFPTFCRPVGDDDFMCEVDG